MGAAPAGAATASGCPCKRQPLVVALPTGCLPVGRIRNRSPLAVWPLAAVCKPLAIAPTAWQQVAAAHCGHRASAGHPRVVAPVVWPRAGAAPLRLALAAAGRPFAGGLAAADRPFAWGPWLQSVVALQVVGCPFKVAGRGHARLPLAWVSFAAKMQQECVERSYVIQSHHTQFKTNLSHENLGSNTTVGKPTMGASHA
ncbi:hypothetical protein GW17_00030395 [Ensete ventricosum]|nr:hypothetical protein GW17_00030395 [Ensete ventricosum]RZR93538.1 hypothetical protein BHM03_00022047 [Ensete ventricosum]